MKRIVPESRSRMANRNGRSTINHGGALLITLKISTDVTAAASVPYSSTWMNVLCFTLLM